MTKFEGTFSGHTTGGGPDIKTIAGIAAAAGLGAVIYESARHAAAAIGNVAATGVTAAVSVALTLAGTWLVLRLRGRSRNTVEARDGQALPPGIRWQHNPRSIPVPERPAIAAPAPVTVINNFGGLASELAAEVAGLLYERQQQPAPVYVQSVRSESQQEIRP